jgi:hypothetical protein
MSNFDPNNALSIDSNVINYNYSYGVEIYKSSSSIPIQGPNSAQTYYKIPYDNKVNTNLFFSGVTPPSYTAKNIYFFGLLHNNVTGKSDPGTAYTGEIVIEHTNQSNSNTIFTCFFIQPDTTNTADTSIDKIKRLVNNEAGANVVLTAQTLSDIPKQSQYFFYNDTQNPKDIVILFLTPFTVNQTTAKWFSNLYTFDSTTFRSPLFTIQSPLNLPRAPAAGADNPKNDDNQIYIDCNPSGESDETITTYNLPINSELMGQKQQMDFMKTSVNFFIFIIATILAYFAIPALYKKIVIDKTIANVPEPDLKKRIRSIDLFISLLVAVGISMCFYFGFTKDDFSFLSGGLFLLVMFGLSFALIYANKSDKNWTTNVLDYGEGTIETSFSDFLDFLKLVLLFIFSKMLKYYFAAVIIAALIIFVVGVYTSMDTNLIKNKILLTATILAPIMAVVTLLMN